MAVSDFFFLKSVSAGALAAAALVGPAAAQLVAAGSKATITVEYEYVSKGKRQDKYDTNEWDVRRYVEVTGTVVATKPIPQPGLHKPDAAMTKDADDRMAAGQRAQKSLQPTMNDMMAIVEKCGENEACIEREVMAYADANRDDLNATREKVAPDAAIVSKKMADRYQIWQPTGEQKARYEARESVRLVDADPICRSRPNQRCTRTESRIGGGAMPLPPDIKKGDANAAGVGTIEVDASVKDMIVVLPQPMMPLLVSQTIETDHPEQQGGVSERYMNLPLKSRIKPITVILSGTSIAQRGELTFDIKDGSDNPRTLESSVIDNGKLTVRWRVTPH